MTQAQQHEDQHGDDAAIRDDLVARGLLTAAASPKGQVISKAAHLFRERGFERTTVRDLARDVGILPGSIFHHFRTKDEILRVVMREGIILNLARIRARLPRCETPAERLRMLIAAELWAINGDTGEMWTVLVREWRSLSAEGQASVLELREEYEEIWLSVLGAAHADGVIGSDPFITRRLIAGALNWTVNWFRPDGALSLDELAEEVFRLATGAGGPKCDDRRVQHAGTCNQ